MKFGLVLTSIALLTLAWLPSVGQADQTLTLALDAPDLGATAKSSDSPVATGGQAASEPQTKSQASTMGRVGLVQGKATIYRSPSGTATKYATVKPDTPLAIVKEQGEWYGVLMVNGATGWISRSCVKMTGYELVQEKPVRGRSFGVSRGGSVDRPTTVGQALIEAAMQYTGVRYIYGGTNPSTGMDCSAFVRKVFSQFDVSLPRTAREQAQVGTTVPFEQLQPGDRLYFSCKNSYVDHCGIYAGDGFFVHCSVRQGGVGVDSLTSDFYWRNLVIAKRS